MTASFSLRVRPFTPTILGHQARRDIDERLCNSQDQESTHSPFIIPSGATIPSLLIDGPDRRRPSAGVMPRSGYDTTNMRVAANPRPAGSAAGTGNLRNDKTGGGGNSDGSGSGSDKGVGSREKGNNGRGDNHNGSKETAEQEPGLSNEGGEPATENTIDMSIPWTDVRIPLEGRGWTFWL